METWPIHGLILGIFAKAQFRILHSASADKEVLFANTGEN